MSFSYLTDLPRTIRNLSLVFLMLCSGLAMAQLNTNSPYSRYGIGELYEEAVMYHRTMGGAGIGLHSGNMQGPYQTDYLNMMNAASLGFTGKHKNLGSLMSFDVAFTQRNQWLKSADQEEYNPLGQLQYAAMKIPVAKNWGMGFAIQPMSSVGYYFVTNDSAAGTGLVENVYLGNGGLNKFSWGNGVKFKIDTLTHLGFGAEVNYLFGNIYNEQRVIFKDPGSVFNTWYNDELVTSDASFDLGMLFNTGFNVCRKRDEKTGKCRDKQLYNLGLGVTYSMQQDLNSKLSRLGRTYSGSIGLENVKDTALNIVDSTVSIGLPQAIGFGISIQKPQYWTFVADYQIQNWGDLNGDLFSNLTNSHRFAAGFEWVIGDPRNVTKDRFPNGSRLRLGVKYLQSNLSLNNTQLEDFGITFGFGLRLRKTLSQINLGAEIGRRGTTDNDLIQETYANFSLGITLNNWWFRKARYE